MGVLEKLMFWKRDDTPEHVDGYTVDGCFTLPDGEPIPGTEQLRSTDLQTDSATVEPPAEQR